MLGRKTLQSKEARNLLNWNFYEFSVKLKQKCEETGTTLIRCNESYTSQTCGNCGKLNAIKKKRELKCSYCDLEIDRDVNGARNIMLRSMGAIPINLKTTKKTDEKPSLASDQTKEVKEINSKVEKRNRKFFVEYYNKKYYDKKDGRSPLASDQTKDVKKINCNVEKRNKKFYVNGVVNK